MSEAEKVNLENCQEDDVLRFEDEVCLIYNLEKTIYNFLYIHAVDMADHFKNKLKIANPVRDRDMNYKEWVQYGKECEILKQGEKWRKGKVKFSIKFEFFSDETEEEKLEENSHQEVENITESPLDEIRQQLTEESKS